MIHNHFGQWPITLALVALLLASTPTAAGEAEKSEKSAPTGTPKTQTVRVLVAYYSLYGNTEQLAKGVVDGIKRVPGAVAVLKKVDQVSKQDLQAADAVILGCPTYFGNIPGKMKVAIDDWNWKMKVDFTDKVGGAFSTGAGQTGGKEFVVVSLLMFLINNRMVVAGPLYQDAEGDDKWAEAGASAITGPLDPGVGDKELDGGRRLGQRVARLAKKLRAD